MDTLDPRFRLIRDGGEFGTETLVLPTGISPSAIPARFRRVIDARHRKFLRDPCSVVAGLAARADIEPLRRWFEAQLETARFDLVIHRFEVGDHDVSTDVTVRGVLPTFRRERYFRLPPASSWWRFDFRKRELALLPPALRSLYTVTDGVVEELDVFQSAGFERLSELELDLACLDPEVPPERASEIDWDRMLVFYSTATGDHLVCCDNDVYAYCHEGPSLHDVGRLDEVIVSYFECDLTCREWNPFPY